MSEELIRVEYIIPKDMEDAIAEKINESVKDAYFWDVTRAISNKVIEALSSDGFTDRVCEAVVEKIKISKDDFIEGVTDQIKDSLMQTTGIIAKEVINKVQEKVKSYGFIRIGS